MFPLPELLGGLPQLTLVVSASQQNYNAYTAAGSPAYPVALLVIVNSGVTVSSASTATASLRAAGFAAGSTYSMLIYGSVQGAGGAAGDGGAGDNGSGFIGTSGSAGGDAISTDAAVSIRNNGAIQGGGGGGAGGQGGTDAGSAGGGGGGGGGEGNIGGAGAIGGAGFGAGGAGGTGAAGTPSVLGAGGIAGTGTTPGHAGGNGGGYGVAGQSTQGLAVGGAAGFAVRCSTGHATITGSGTVNGSVS